MRTPQSRFLLAYLYHDRNAEEVTASGKRSISAFRLAMITYFFTCGGPFGIESAVGAAGPLYSLIAVFAIPIFWALPQALMSAELSLMMNQNGGKLNTISILFSIILNLCTR